MRPRQTSAFAVWLMLNAVDATAQARPEACAVRLEAVDPEGRRLRARVDVLDPPSGVAVEHGTVVCLNADPEVTSVRVLVSADGYQPHATDPIALQRGVSREVVVTLTRPFAETLTVEGRTTNLVGIAESASAGVVGSAELASRPLIRAGDIIEAVPGVAMTQHSSGGHAPIILLRGYNLDHGTDFGTSLEGAPLNLPSHAHAQGYTDTNFLIEDVVERIEFQKGPYSPRAGNFSTAGAANIEIARSLPENVVRLEGGENAFRRAMAAASFGTPRGQWLVAGEASHDDGPSVVPDDFARVKGMAKYSSTSGGQQLAVTVASYGASWSATDGYPQRALDRGYLTRFGTLDASDGGRTQQHLVISTLQRTSGRRVLALGAFARYYDLDLFSNLTFWTTSPQQGDQIWQAERRASLGGHASFSRSVGESGPLEFTTALQVRHDLARVRLRNAERRIPIAKLTAAGAVLPESVYDNRIADSSVAPLFDLRVRATSWLRVNGGIRADVVRMRVASDRMENSGTRWAGLASPKGSVVFGPWRGTEFYVNGGLGFHSNHAGGVMQRVDPVEGTRVRADGTEVVSAPPLVRTKGAETGMRIGVGNRVQSSVAFWMIDSDSELVYTAEDGVTSPERPGRRRGVEWLNVVKLTRRVTADLDAAWSSARYRTDPLGEGRLIPDAAQAVLGGGATLTTARVGAAIRARYVGRRPLLPDGSAFVDGSLVLNLQVEVRVSRRVRIAVNAFNLLDTRYEDTAYFYATRLRDPRTGMLEPAPVGDYVTHPGQPRTIRAGLRIGL